MSKIFVGNLNFGTMPEEIYDMFNEFGRIVNISLVKNYSFVTMSDKLDANAAVDAMDGDVVRGRKLTVEISRSAGPDAAITINYDENGKQLNFPNVEEYMEKQKRDREYRRSNGKFDRRHNDRYERYPQRDRYGNSGPYDRNDRYRNGNDSYNRGNRTRSPYAREHRTSHRQRSRESSPMYESRRNVNNSRISYRE
ncbi:hypothetical protein A3Q56_03409 [Intoshia linei]|uniref:RRM domain-containing protein n=1 Tax=Intoshia linei TaxID=1819745 RepID=A0A177B404_9BILA|nr:hypothetical protein A3Q56_03409 [Intoshia linei]